MDEPERISSPDGTYAVLLFPMEMRMSHWLALLRIVGVAGNRAILDLTETMWSMETVRWSDDSTSVSLAMRRYPGSVPSVTVALDLRTQMAEIEAATDRWRVSLAQLPPLLEAYYRKRQKR